MDNSNVGCAVTPLNLLAIVFVVLKLTGVIAWSWWWVLAPIWIPMALGVIFLVVSAVCFLGAWWVAYR